MVDAPRIAQCILDDFDVLIVIEEYGLFLTFDSLSQRLSRVGAKADYPPGPANPTLMFEGQTVHGPESPGDCRKVVSVFPPTTLGLFKSDDLSYQMHFKNGLEVKLSIASLDLFNSFAQRREHPVGLSEYSPRIDSINVFSANPSAHAVDSLPRLEVVPQEGVRFFASRERQAAWIQLGCGLQDVMSVLGEPDDKCGDTYNFFSQGIDVEVDASRYCSVKKIILHFNIPGHILFGRYNRCWFDIGYCGTEKCTGKSKPISEEGTKSIDNKSKLHEFNSMFGDAGQPLVVNNSRSPVVRYFYTFAKGIVAEFTPSGTLACIEISAKS